MNEIEVFDGIITSVGNEPRVVEFVTDGTYNQVTVDTAAKEFAKYLNEYVSYGFVEALYHELREVVE